MVRLSHLSKKSVEKFKTETVRLQASGAPLLQNVFALRGTRGQKISEHEIIDRYFCLMGCDYYQCVHLSYPHRQSGWMCMRGVWRRTDVVGASYRDSGPSGPGLGRLIAAETIAGRLWPPDTLIRDNDRLNTSFFSEPRNLLLVVRHLSTSHYSRMFLSLYSLLWHALKSEPSSPTSLHFDGASGRCELPTDGGHGALWVGKNDRWLQRADSRTTNSTVWTGRPANRDEGFRHALATSCGLRGKLEIGSTAE